MEIAKPTHLEVFEAADTGDVFVSKGTRWISQIVCWVLKSDYSHTFVKVSGTSIIEANDLGVQEVNAEAFLKTCKTITNLSFPGGVSTRVLFISNLRFLLGQKYDNGILLGGLWSRLWHRSRRHEGLLNDENGYTCSELVSTALERCGFILPFPPSQITPEDLYYFMIEELLKYVKLNDTTKDLHK